VKGNGPGEINVALGEGSEGSIGPGAVSRIVKVKLSGAGEQIVEIPLEAVKTANHPKAS
jgi:hypothetical protein